MDSFMPVRTNNQPVPRWGTRSNTLFARERHNARVPEYMVANPAATAPSWFGENRALEPDYVPVSVARLYEQAHGLPVPRVLHGVVQFGPCGTTGECGACMTELTVEDEAMIGPCGHAFHVCLKFTIKTRGCPLCRAPWPRMGRCVQVPIQDVWVYVPTPEPVVVTPLILGKPISYWRSLLLGEVTPPPRADNWADRFIGELSESEKAQWYWDHEHSMLVRKPIGLLANKRNVLKRPLLASGIIANKSPANSALYRALSAQYPVVVWFGKLRPLKKSPDRKIYTLLDIPLGWEPSNEFNFQWVVVGGTHLLFVPHVFENKSSGLYSKDTNDLVFKRVAQIAIDEVRLANLGSPVAFPSYLYRPAFGGTVEHREWWKDQVYRHFSSVIWYDVEE